MKQLNWPGIEAGDVVLIHSSLRRTCRENKVNPGEVLQSFIDAVGPKGTVIFPVFNFSGCHGEPFDYYKTSSISGILTETARKHPAAWRAQHPISGYVAIGKLAPAIGVLENEFAYVQGVLPLLHTLNAKIAILDLNAQAAITFVHYVEQTHGVDWRYSKFFTEDYTDKHGKTEERTFELNVKHGWGETHIDPMDEVLWEMGLYEGDRPGVDSGLRVIKAVPFFDTITTVMKHGRGEGLIWRRTEDRPAITAKQVRDRIEEIKRQEGHLVVGENDEAWERYFAEQAKSG